VAQANAIGDPLFQSSTIFEGTLVPHKSWVSVAGLSQLGKIRMMEINCCIANKHYDFSKFMTLLKSYLCTKQHIYLGITKPMS
jgi:hypothetical protein